MPKPYRLETHTVHQNAAPHRQPFHHPHTALGAAGHWLKTAGILAPLVIGEFIKDPEKKWRAIRISALATVLFSEALWTHRVMKDKQAAVDDRQHDSDLESALNTAFAGSNGFAR